MKSLLLGIVLILLSSVPVFAQNPPGGPPPIDRRNQDRIRQQDMSNREWQLRNFGKNAKPKENRSVEALMAQVEEDFNRILTLHNEIARALTSDNALNYNFVSEAMTEINKRASRVQSNLRLELSAEDAVTARKPKKFESAEMKDALIVLCKQIRSFVTNPVIENPNMIDVNEAVRARRDLEGVIHLSGEIKKDADKLSKN